jgi:uncharacterized membrane protein
MGAILVDWAGLFVRWIHVMVGIAWIGTSFHFIWLDASLRRNAASPKGVGGESWMVHGGGFYHAQKYLVAPEALPKELHWFKYEAYFTWITGFLLLAIVYYLNADAFLIDPGVLDLSPAVAIAISVGSLVAGWLIYDAICRSPLGRDTVPLALLVFLLAVAAAIGFTHVFSGRAAFVHVGAFLGTIMAANVFFIIIPNQKKVVASLLAGQSPDPTLGQTAKQRSLHNNYLTLPVVLMMISNHYPILYDNNYGWAFLIGIFALSFLVRHYANEETAGKPRRQLYWLLGAAAVVGIVIVVANVALLEAPEPGMPAASTGSTAGGGAAAPAGPPVQLAEIVPIIQQRCLSCHSATPSDAAFKKPPKGITFDTPEQIDRMAPQIYRLAVRTRVMPLGNRTQMTMAERATLGRWIEGRAAK